MKLQLCMLPLLILLSACKDTGNDVLLEKNTMRLSQQNDLLKARKESLINALEAQKQRLSSIPLSHHYDLYKHLFKVTDSLLHYIENAEKAGAEMSPQYFFRNYAEVQKAFTQITKIVDQRGQNDSNFIRFMHFDAASFWSEYFSPADAKGKANQLLLLEADILMTYNFFLENAYRSQYDEGPTFDEFAAIAIPEKVSYSRGEKMKVHALIVKFDAHTRGEATIDGHTIKPADGIFTYSRKVTEKAGEHKLRVAIKTSINGETVTYSAAVQFYVK